MDIQSDPFQGGLIWRPRLPLSPKERLLARSIINAETGCREWNGSCDRHGYGRTCAGGKERAAHRLAWEVFKGVIPEGACVLHRCDNRLCINPDHLFVGTDAENSADKIAKGRQSRGENNGLNKLTEAQVLVIRRTSGRLKDIADQYGMSITAISEIKRRKKWRHI